MHNDLPVLHCMCPGYSMAGMMQNDSRTLLYGAWLLQQTGALIFISAPSLHNFTIPPLHFMVKSCVLEWPGLEEKAHSRSGEIIYVPSIVALKK